ncbi:MAG: CDP-alcohol phosphatidyltransferase family protein [Treponema sp.]|nr:CDP-alcohol phosphatidyltransferase family protein [Treponema sp.]
MENNKAAGFIRFLPNIATLTRLFGAFSLFFLLDFEKDIGPFKAVPWIWLLVYLFLVATDAIDGILARKLNVKSDFGAFLDAFSDTVLLVIGAAIVFVVFAKDNLTEIQTWIYIGLLIFCSANKLSMNLYAKKFFGIANMLHSYPQKAFAAGCYIGVGFWAFIRGVPWWSVVFLIILNLYGAIDEIVYCARAAEYNVDFKGHGFQKYELRKKQQ